MVNSLALFHFTYFLLIFIRCIFECSSHFFRHPLTKCTELANCIMAIILISLGSTYMVSTVPLAVFSLY
jgi:hypothetical protein